MFNPKYKIIYNDKGTAIKPFGLKKQPLLEQANISMKNVQHFFFRSKEPWTQNPLKINLDLHKSKKSEVDSHIFKIEFLEVKSTYKHHICVYTDGSKQDKRLPVLLSVQISRTVLEYLTTVLFLPLKPRLLILHFII